MIEVNMHDVKSVSVKTTEVREHEGTHNHNVTKIVVESKSPLGRTERLMVTLFSHALLETPNLVFKGEAECEGCKGYAA